MDRNSPQRNSHAPRAKSAPRKETIFVAQNKESVGKSAPQGVPTSADRSEKVLEMGLTSVPPRPVVVARTVINSDESWLTDDKAQEANIEKLLFTVDGNGERKARYTGARFVPNIVIGSNAGIEDAVTEFRRFVTVLTEYAAAERITIKKPDGTVVYDGRPAPAMPKGIVIKGDDGAIDAQSVPSYCLMMLRRNYKLAHQQDLNADRRDDMRRDAENPAVLAQRGITGITSLRRTKGATKTRSRTDESY